MRKHTLVGQIVHDVINTLSCLLFEIDSPLAMECVYQLRFFQAIHENKIDSVEEFEDTFMQEIKHFRKEHDIIIYFISISDPIKQILIFLILNKKACMLTVHNEYLICEQSNNFDYRIFESDNGILNSIQFVERFKIEKEENKFYIRVKSL